MSWRLYFGLVIVVASLIWAGPDNRNEEYDHAWMFVVDMAIVAFGCALVASWVS